VVCFRLGVLIHLRPLIDGRCGGQFVDISLFLTFVIVRVLFTFMTGLTPVSEEDVTFAIRMSISLDYRGKPRRVNAKMTGAEMDALAQKITEQLKRSNMWPHRGPGAPAHQAPDYSVAWRTEAALDDSTEPPKPDGA